MKKEVYTEIKNKVEKLEALLNGGKGSGNFGHSGRPGEVGGSGKGTGSSSDYIDRLSRGFAAATKIGDKETAKHFKQKIEEAERKATEEGFRLMAEQTLDDFGQINIEEHLKDVEAEYSTKADDAYSKGNESDGLIYEGVLSSLSEVRSAVENVRACVGEIRHSEEPSRLWAVEGGLERVVDARLQLAQSVKDLQSGYSDSIKRSFEQVISQAKRIEDATTKMIDNNETLLDLREKARLKK